MAKLIHLHESFCRRNQTSLPPLQKRFDFHTLVAPAFIKSNPHVHQTETSLLKQHAAGERVDLLDDYDFPARTITFL